MPNFFSLYGTPAKIAESALGTIINSKAKQVISFESYAYGLLVEKAPELRFAIILNCYKHILSNSQGFTVFGKGLAVDL